MKNFFSFCVVFAMSLHLVLAQEERDTTSDWEFSADVNFYFIPDDFFILPVFKADKNKLHLEARYNYEDLETFSAWVGYNLNGGNAFEYAFTPMVGGVAGLANGIATGLEMTLGYKGFELYSESEYMFDFELENFFYNWSDFTYLPNDWLWFGISGQRTRVYQTELEIQRGLLIGAGVKQWELTSYLYNIGTDDTFFLLTLSVGF
ncbi:MAG TPA: hypothetical protein VFW11_07105 [Cyclobacteriaceae bacterium]|nr:hypothetical protein [Cyclobacteriaceae bacterium]